MPSLLVSAAVLALSLGPHGTAAGAARHELVIRPSPSKEWQADIENVRQVLASAANELWAFFPGRRLAPILVEPRGGPIVLFSRGPHGEYRVHLDTGRTYWAQYAFQFAHEFTHILCGYDAREEANKWFEESLCEMASLFALRRMAVTWKTQPPYPNWRDFAPHLHQYADERLNRFRLPDGETLAAWYRQHEAELRQNATNREKNGVVAGALLPLFESEPQHWAAVEHLNASARREPRSFEQYLFDWLLRTPPEHHEFIRTLARQFGLELPAH